MRIYQLSYMIIFFPYQWIWVLICMNVYSICMPACNVFNCIPLKAVFYTLVTCQNKAKSTLIVSLRYYLCCDWLI